MTEIEQKPKFRYPLAYFLGSIVVSIPACHAGDRGSIPRRGGFFFLTCLVKLFYLLEFWRATDPKSVKIKKE